MNDFILFLLIMAVLKTIPHGTRRYQTWRWQQQLQLKKHHATFKQLYQPINGFTLSREARQQQDAMEYTYGEIEFLSFIALLGLARPDQSTRFYDLGSGTGKAVIASALVYPMAQYYGVELFESLHHAAESRAAQLTQLPYYKEYHDRIHFIHKDLFHVCLKNATLIFVNTTAFFGDSWIALTHHLATTKPKTCIITIGKCLNHENFTITHQTKVQMSWGIVNATLHERIV